MEVSVRDSCRVCGASALLQVLSLGEQHIASSFDDSLHWPVALELMRCGECGLVQLRHTVSRSALYERYWYRSGVNQTMTDHLHGIARQAAEMVDLRGGELVIDIGCNDGTLLDAYPENVRRVGYEPSDLAVEAQKRHRVVPDFFSAEAPVGEYVGRARIVTSIAMFYDLEDPCAFARDVARVLAPDGVWILECHYLPSMLLRNQYDAICHEHLEYYSLSAIERVLEGTGLRVLQAHLNETNGGSVRLFIGHGLVDRSVGRLRSQEARITPSTYADFARMVFAQIRDLRELCRGLARDGHQIHVYGASTKGNVILQAASLGPEEIPFAADRNPAKHGHHTATGIPIISEAQSREMRPDYYLALPWHFRKEFVEREGEWLRAGGRFIWPLPTVRVAARRPRLAA